METPKYCKSDECFNYNIYTIRGEKFLEDYSIKMMKDFYSMKEICEKCSFCNREILWGFKVDSSDNYFK